MAIAFDTGQSEERSCSYCGAIVRHRESATRAHGRDIVWWHADKHEAPCGLPCLNGGVRPQDYRAKQVHGVKTATERWCPRCGDLTPTPEEP